MKRTTLSIIAAALLLVPYVASACTVPDVWKPSTILNTSLVSCTGNIYTVTGAPGTLNTNACSNLCDLVCTTTRVIYFGIAFVIWIILPIMIIVGGIMYMMGGANPGMLETAKKTLWGAVIGAIIVLCAYILVAVFIKFVNISKIGGFPDANGNTPPACTISS